MKNVLIFFENTDNSDYYRKSAFALVPKDLLNEYDLEEINGNSANSDSKVANDISMLLDRLGLIPFHPTLSETEKLYYDYRKLYAPPPFRTTKDLEKYVDPVPPFVIDELVVIYA